MTRSSDPPPSSPHRSTSDSRYDDATTQLDSRDHENVARRLHDQAESMPMADGNPRRSTANRPQGHWSQSLRSMDKWWTILLLLFGVTGVLGLPVLWVSRSFGLGMKLVLSVAVTIYTALLCWGVYLIFLMAYDAIRQTI